MNDNPCNQDKRKRDTLFTDTSEKMDPNTMIQGKSLHHNKNNSFVNVKENNFN